MSSSIYKTILIENYKNPKNEGLLDEFTHESKVANRSCGDEAHLQLYINKEGIIEKVGYKMTGCAVSIASMSLLSEKIKGLHIKAIEKIEEQDIFDMMGIDERSGRGKCVLLSRDALRSAIDV